MLTVVIAGLRVRRKEVMSPLRMMSVLVTRRADGCGIAMECKSTGFAEGVSSSSN